MENPLLPLGDMEPEEFRRQGHQLIDWIAEYLAHPERYPVLSQISPGQIKSQLPLAPPSQSEPMATILADFEQVLLPGITHWNHPGFFGYFAISGSGPGILGELLCAALNVNGMLWRTSPAATELEEVTLDWLRQLLGLPATFSGIIMDTASTGILTVLVAAREHLGLHARQHGTSGLPPLRIYASEQAHSSIEKAAIATGFGQEGVRKIAVDAEFRLDPAALARAIAEDRARGWRPCCVVATVGTTSTTSIDPVPAIAALCREEGLWLHVDGAYGGMAALVPECRQVLAGCDLADSIVVNPHKWLFTPIDCSALYVKDPHLLRQTFSLVPEYLQSPEAEVTNYMDWGVQLGRRFRALKLWMVLRHFGQEGLAARLREHLRLGQLFAGWVDQSPCFERLAPVPFSTVCFRARPPGAEEQEVDAINERLLQRINTGGEVFLSHTLVQGHYALRLAVGHIRTQERHVARAWELLQEGLNHELG
ncbi:MAG: amino acid decarboxylase [Candidatus Latescibacteria bacterium]|nr:amino acid decarboxylase [Candidatus Latescibacterota bacterium]